jgi:hypothetical protein
MLTHKVALPLCHVALFGLGGFTTFLTKHSEVQKIRWLQLYQTGTRVVANSFRNQKFVLQNEQKIRESLAEKMIFMQFS